MSTIPRCFLIQLIMWLQSFYTINASIYCQLQSLVLYFHSDHVMYWAKTRQCSFIRLIELQQGLTPTAGFTAVVSWAPVHEIFGPFRDYPDYSVLTRSRNPGGANVAVAMLLLGIFFPLDLHAKIYAFHLASGM